MATTPDVYSFGDNGGGFFGNGFGSGFLGGIIGGALFNGGFVNWGGGGNGAAAAALGAQAQNNNNTDLLMNAVTNVGTTIGQDFNTLNTSLTGIGSTLNGLAVTQATTPLQITNAIQTGNMALQQQLSNCCCENRLATCQQTNEIVSEIKNQTVAMNDGFCQIREREMQQQIDAKNDIINQLRDQAQTNTINGQIALLQQQIAALAARIPVTATQQPTANL